MKTALVVLNYNDATRCIDVVNYGVTNQIFDYYILVDNNSNKTDLELLNSARGDNIFLILNKENKGYGSGHNAGLRYAVEKLHVDFVFVIVSDIEYTKESILECISVLSNNSNIGAITCRIRNLDGTEGEAAWYRPTYKDFLLWCYPMLRKFRSTEKYNFDSDANYSIVDVIRGSFIGFSALALKECDYFDENVFLYNEENIIADRMRIKGYDMAILHSHFYLHKHINKRSRHKKISELYKEAESGIYYMKQYQNIKGIKLFLLIFSTGILVLLRFVKQG